MLDASTRIDVLNLLGDLKGRGPRDPLHHARPVARELHQRPDPDPAPRPRRRARADAEGVRRPAALVHAGAPLVRAAAASQVERRGGRGGVGRERRPACSVGEWRRPRRRRRRPLRRTGGGPGVSRIGLQLYTVRDAAATDLARTLGRAAELGFDGVELHDLHGHAPDEVRAMLDAHDLAVCGRHVGLEAAEDDLGGLAAELETLGTDRLIVAWIEPPRTPVEADAAVARLVRAAERAVRGGPAARLPQPRRRGCGAVRRAERPRSPSRRRRRAVPRARPGLGVVRRRRPDRAARRRPRPRAARARQGHAPRRRAGARSARGRRRRLPTASRTRPIAPAWSG